VTTNYSQINNDVRLLHKTASRKRLGTRENPSAVDDSPSRGIYLKK